MFKAKQMLNKFMALINCYLHNFESINLYMLRPHQLSVKVSALPSSVVDRGFEPRSGQTKEYKIGICFLCKAPSIKEKE